ncbi:MAG: hypothetical protein N2446_01205 [Elusimicrobiales bacterium]|nr:hypothetical protein [Elusimicrobiales bacterium]
MSEIKASRMLCKDCGYEPNIIADVCIKCGGKIVKICGNCSHENSVEKNHCDLCGNLLALTPHKKIDIVNDKKDNFDSKIEKGKKILEFESITETIARKDESYRKKINIPNANVESVAKEKLVDEDAIIKERRKVEDFVKLQSNQIERQKFEEKNNIINRKIILFKKITISVFTFGLIIIIFYLIFGRKSFSRYDLLITAKRYLSALRDAEYDKAYEFLSQNSKAIVSFNDYVKTLENYYSKVGKWDFKDIEVYYFDPNQSVIKYKLIEKGVEKDDYLNFVREYGKWRRPFVYNLFEEIDKAFEKKDFPKALFLSQRLYLIDPMDPRASGYLCWSEYLMRIYENSVESCKRVIELSHIYPIKYYKDEELFWYTFNYADSLRFIGKIEHSIEVYNNILKNPIINSDEKCTVYVARSDSYVAIKDYNSSLNDLKNAIEVCKDESIEKKEALRRLRMLEGELCEEAILFAKKYKNEGIPFEEFIINKFKSLNKEKYKFDWRCKHKNGSNYYVEVLVYEGKKSFNVYKINVDLWEKKFSIEEEL